MLMEKYKIWRNEILSWPSDFFELAIEKSNVDWQIKKEMMESDDKDYL